MNRTTSPSAPTNSILTLVLWRLGGWMPASIFALHVVLHEVFNAYATVPGLDIPMHVAGGVAIALVAGRVFDWMWSPPLGPAPAVIRYLFAIGLTAFAAVVWEFAEFLSDHYLGTRVQTGLDDTLLDMAMGLTGGIGYLAWHWLRQRAPSAPSPRRESARVSADQPIGTPSDGFAHETHQVE